MASIPAPAVYQDEQFLVGPALDLTLYVADLMQSDFDVLFELYRSVSPADRRARWKVAEHFHYQPYHEAARGPSLDSPEIKRFRHRLANGWRAEFRVWDGRTEESWSFHCYRLPRTEDAPPAAFYRFLLPATADPAILWRAAETVITSVSLLSGHGGYTLLYDGSRLVTAFNCIYPLARRYWGFDVEHLNSNVRLMRDGIKGASWLTLLGPASVDQLGGPAPLEALAGDGIEVTAGPGGVLVAAGPAPDLLDQNRPCPALGRYEKIAATLEPAFLPAFPDLPGRFATEGDSFAWLRRFLEPAEWRR